MKTVKITENECLEKKLKKDVAIFERVGIIDLNAQVVHSPSLEGF